MTNVFVSRPSWVHSQFEEGLHGFLRVLTTLGLTPRTLGKTDYPNRAPLDEVIALLEECTGAVILGYPQIHVSSGFVRDEPITSGLLLSTEWNHIEAGLAYARKLPLLVVHHVGVGRGIFDHGATNTFIYERDLTPAHWCLAEEMQGAVKRWMRECLGVKPRVSSIVDSSGGSMPSCPNCLAYMSPIPRDFVAIEGATHECPQCRTKIKL